MPAIAPPDTTEYASYYGRYITLVPGSDVVAALEDQPNETLALLSTLSDEQGDYRYAPGKWSIKEMLGHVIDAERVFAYRALRFARHDQTPLASFEQDDYVRTANFGDSALADLIEEFVCVRRSTVCLFRKLSSDAWMRRGVASDNPVSVRAIAYIIAGHELHHRRILQEKYLPRVMSGGEQ
ncbi:MAG TPA: DinB family protein [Bryobacteraceae bacterium]|nr:DinB family protein [Bryobacteraceae bacterium]